MTYAGYRFGQSEAGRRIERAGLAFEAHLREQHEREVRKAREAEAASLREAAKRLAIEEERRLNGMGHCARIMEEEAKAAGCELSDLRSDRKTRDIVQVRQKAMYRCVVETVQSLPQIGRAFHKDHTTVIAGIRSHCRRTGDPYPPGMKPPKGWKP